MSINTHTKLNKLQHNLNEVQSLFASHLIIRDIEEKKLITNDELWQFFEKAYFYADGFKSFEDLDDMLNRSFFYKIVYDGQINNLSDFTVDKCYVIGIYKNKNGIKRVAVATNLNYDEQKRHSAYEKLVKQDLTKAWVEVSGKAERVMIKKCNAMEYLIDPLILKTVKGYENIEILEDNMHYKRYLSKDPKNPHDKIAFGTIRI
jgi:hypothetical protein